ncbi:hypothetical protein [Microbacterium sp. VKM Ac-2923]|uniref:hypothetical protein n=1 Tax=Microbacterium sp. VKM Ac-2923 TaxID=2929476 RepID=UPI001FB26228|nr:hypothetical protein [Microbacterium sp. VKM Ac-2923]MCJ1709285.1 hypothetical protein [Microbacterium sp. VKM Ac-2923]
MSVRKEPAKAVEKAFRDLGATKETQRHGVNYTFPDGATKLVPQNLRWGHAHELMSEATRRYGYAPRGVAGTQERGRDVPQLDLRRLDATPHAKERMNLMRRQAGIRVEEVMTTLVCPIRVMWSRAHGSWVWVGERVGVAVQFRDNGHAEIRTLLWSTAELWELHPRPQKENSR